MDRNFETLEYELKRGQPLIPGTGGPFGHVVKAHVKHTRHHAVVGDSTTRELSQEFPDTVQGRTAALCWIEDRLVELGVHPRPVLTDIERRVCAIVADELGAEPEKVTPASRFIEDLGADSLDVAELVIRIEDHFEIQIDDEQAQACHTVADAIALVMQELEGRAV